MSPQWVIAALVGTSMFLACAGVAPRLVSAASSSLTWRGRLAGMRHATSRVLASVGGTGWGQRLVRLETLRRRLELAGSHGGLQTAAGAEISVAVGAGVGTLLFAFLVPAAIALSPVAVLAAARGFELIVGRRARRRQERMAASVPDLVELLVATTDAGLSPAVALQRTASLLHGPLGEELRWAVSEVELGAPWQRAIERMVTRTEVPSLRALAAAVFRSQQRGTVLGTTLRRVAEDLRRERRTRAEEAARKAPIKMLFPLVFLILPAFLLLTVGPVVLATIRSLR